jgi:hypothetical protein
MSIGPKKAEGKEQFTLLHNENNFVTCIGHVEFKILKCRRLPCVSHVDDDHVDGVRLCLCTAATNGPTVHTPGDI